MVTPDITTFERWKKVIRLGRCSNFRTCTCFCRKVGARYNNIIYIIVLLSYHVCAYNIYIYCCTGWVKYNIIVVDCKQYLYIWVRLICGICSQLDFTLVRPRRQSALCNSSKTNYTRTVHYSMFTDSYVNTKSVIVRLQKTRTFSGAV